MNLRLIVENFMKVVTVHMFPAGYAGADFALVRRPHLHPMPRLPEAGSYTRCYPFCSRSVPSIRCLYHRAGGCPTS